MKTYLNDSQYRPFLKLVLKFCYFRKKNAAISARYQGGVTDCMNQIVEQERLYTPQQGRNKSGMVFNEKVVVSPVPFIRTTRESFSTLKTAPIQILGQSTNTSWSRGKCKFISFLKKSLIFNFFRNEETY